MFSHSAWAPRHEFHAFATVFPTCVKEITAQLTAPPHMLSVVKHITARWGTPTSQARHEPSPGHYSSLQNSTRNRCMDQQTADLRCEFLLDIHPERKYIDTLVPVWSVLRTAHKKGKNSLQPHNLSSVEHNLWTNSASQCAHSIALWLCLSVRCCENRFQSLLTEGLILQLLCPNSSLRTWVEPLAWRARGLQSRC